MCSVIVRFPPERPNRLRSSRNSFARRRTPSSTLLVAHPGGPSQGPEDSSELNEVGGESETMLSQIFRVASSASSAGSSTHRGYCDHFDFAVKHEPCGGVKRWIAISDRLEACIDHRRSRRP